MSEPVEPVDPEACTAVLLSVPQEVAERIASFLTVNGVACQTRPNDEEAEVDVAGSEIPPVWDVLVRPEDMPDGEGAPPSRPAGLNVPAAGPVDAAEAIVAAGEPPDAEADPGGPVVLCELPWSRAWALTERLIAAGIPAAVMAAEEPDRDRPMATRIVPGASRGPRPGKVLRRLMAARRTRGRVRRADALAAFISERCSEARAWSNGPGDTYGRHDHPAHKVLFCLEGSIVFHTDDGDVPLSAGDRLDLEPRTPHAATVGPSGCACVEAWRSSTGSPIG